MSKARCPGQDTRYWKPGDIFSLPCSSCGSIVEFFKDDVNRKCPKCSSKIQNPKISMGCAQWCEHAKECLGYDPALIDESSEDTIGESLSEKIVNEIKIKYGENSPEFRNAETMLGKAIKMLKGETADPKIVISASLLLGLDENSGFPLARNIMKEAGFDNIEIDDICEVMESVVNEEVIDIPEYRVVSDIYALDRDKAIN